MPDREPDPLALTRQMRAMSAVLVWRNAERSLMNAERTPAALGAVVVALTLAAGR